MAETFIALLAAHLVADFPLQPNGLIRRKRNLFILAGHVLVVLALAILALGSAPPVLLAILVGTHLVMDAVKVYALPDTLWAFLTDQGVHLAVIAGLAVQYPGAMAEGWWTGLPAGGHGLYLAGLTLASGLIASLPMGAILIRLGTAGFMAQIAKPIDGLTHGGFYIGILERSLIMLFIFIGQPAGVGLLMAVKSILRFGEVKEPGERKMAEYIIIGTFMSFAWGLLIAILTAAGVGYWLAAFPLRIP